MKEFFFERFLLLVEFSGDIMAHWFHRSPLKATAKQSFHVRMVAHDVEAIKICR